MVRTRLLPLLLAAAGLSLCAQANRFMGAPWLKYYDSPEFKQLVEQGKQKLQAAGVTDTQDRLPIFILYTMAWDLGDVEARCMYCGIGLYQNHVGNSTPVDIFVFVKHDQLETAPDWLKTGNGRWKNVHILPLEKELWTMPGALRPEGYGWSQGFSHGYRLMGQFRLAFSFPYARALGYRYLLQADHDTQVMKPITYNLVKFMDEKGLYLTNKNFFFYEVKEYAMALPELARFWIMSRKHTEKLDGGSAAAHGIVGPILQHIKPSSMEGLKTITKSSAHEEGWEGWDSQCIAGNFNIFSLEWWFQQDIQDFVHLVIRTGAHLEHRWVDVATESMIRHLFCPEDKFLLHEDLSIDHGRNWYCGEKINECLVLGGSPQLPPPPPNPPVPPSPPPRQPGRNH